MRCASTAPPLQVEGGPAETASHWTLSGHGGDLVLRPATEGARPAPAAHGLAALDAAFAAHPECRDLAMHPADPQGPGRAGGGGRGATGGGRHLARLPGHAVAAARALAARGAAADGAALRADGGRYHPRRAPKPHGLLYQRYIPWLGRTFTFRSLEIDEDLPRFNRWMNDPDVAVIWEEEGDLQKHRAYLEG